MSIDEFFRNPNSKTVVMYVSNRLDGYTSVVFSTYMRKPENWRGESEEELESDCDESSGFERSIEKAAGEEDEGTDCTVHH